MQQKWFVSPNTEVAPEVFCEIDVLKNFAKLTFNNLIKKETPTQVIFSEFLEIFKNSIFYSTPAVAASANI